MNSKTGTDIRVGDLLMRIGNDWGSHKVGQSYEVESISKAPKGSTFPDTVRFKGDNMGYDFSKYELDPICRSPLYEALK